MEDVRSASICAVNSVPPAKAACWESGIDQGQDSSQQCRDENEEFTKDSGIEFLF